jgi:hypothetical protein
LSYRSTCESAVFLLLLSLVLSSFVLPSFVLSSLFFSSSSSLFCFF